MVSPAAPRSPSPPPAAPPEPPEVVATATRVMNQALQIARESPDGAAARLAIEELINGDALDQPQRAHLFLRLARIFDQRLGFADQAAEFRARVAEQVMRDALQIARESPDGAAARLTIEELINGDALSRFQRAHLCLRLARVFDQRLGFADQATAFRAKVIGQRVLTNAF